MTKDLRDQVIPVLFLFQSTKGHLGTGDVLFRILEVVELLIRDATSSAVSPSFCERHRNHVVGDKGG